MMSTNVLVLHWGRTGGGPAFARSLAQELMKRESLNVSVSYSSNSETAHAFDRLPVPRLIVSTWNSKIGLVSALLRLPILIFRVRTFMKRHKVDVVVVAMDQVLQALVSRAFNSHGARYIHVLHDGQLHPGENTRLWRALRELHIRPAKALIVLSPSVAELACEKWGFPRSRVFETRLPSSLDAGGFDPSQARGFPSHRPLKVGMFGRVVAYKGFDIGVEAMDIARSHGLDAELILAGDGVCEVLDGVPAGDRPWLRLDDRWIPEDELVELIRGFDCVLLPYREASQSGVLMEAIALGVPVVGTPVGSIGEQIRATGGGLVADAVTPAAVAEKLEYLLTSETTYTRCSTNGAEAARTDFSWARTADDFENAIQATLLEQPAGAK